MACSSVRLVVLAWDLSMSLAMRFQSTLYSWWFFMGAWLSALMMFACS